MKIDYILHNLTELKANVDTIEANVYANLGRIDDCSLSDEELFNLVNYQLRLFNDRWTNLRLELEKERKGEPK